MENGKSPVIDGLPIEFYKSQYEIIKPISFNYTTLSFSQMRSSLLR